ncbi:MAG: alpha/beta hydrolase [Phycisphaerales bacterium]
MRRRACRIAAATVALVLAGCAGTAPMVGVGDAPADRVRYREDWIGEKAIDRSVRFEAFDSVHAGGLVSYHIALPPEYDAEPDARYPVVYWLHGSGGGVAGIPRLAAYFRSAIASREIPPVIVVFPNGLAEGMYCDWKDGSTLVERVIVDDLVAHIDASFRTIPSREGRILDGFSMGGYGAARFGFKYPDRFGAISMLGAGPVQRDFLTAPRTSEARRREVLGRVYGGDLAFFEEVSPWRLAEKHAARLRTLRTPIRIAVGSRDETLAANEALHEHLEALGIAHEYQVLPGVAHEPMRVLMSLRASQWQWYRSVLPKGPALDARARQVLHGGREGREID